MRASDAVMRCRCKIILILVQGKTPTMIAQGGLLRRSLKCTESPLGSSNMARWISLTSPKTMGRIRSPMLTAWSYFDSLKAGLKSTATGVLRGHKNYSFWCSLNEAAFALASPQFVGS